MEKMDWIQWMQKRSSVRTFEHKVIDEGVMNQLEQALEHANHVLLEKACIKLIHNKSERDKTQKLGTYGIIQGARNFIAVLTQKDDVDACVLGYHIERIVLVATGLGLGTCWLGGTFDRSSFEKHLTLSTNEKLVILIALGYQKSKQTMIASTVRIIARSNQRKSSSELFFDKHDKTILDLNSIGKYKHVLEMVRIAPSASNKQPWRIVRCNEHFHFFIARTPGYGLINYDLQRNDIGIAKCHFELSALELGYMGQWRNIASAPMISNWMYVDSWECIDAESK